jgi:hypothetical protein
LFELLLIRANAVENDLHGQGVPHVAHVVSWVALSGRWVLTVRRASVIV